MRAASGRVGALLRSHLDKLGAAFRGSQAPEVTSRPGPSGRGWALTSRGQGWPSLPAVGWGGVGQPVLWKQPGG